LVSIDLWICLQKSTYSNTELPSSFSKRLYASTVCLEITRIAEEKTGEP
jgi:hypothetical protein